MTTVRSAALPLNLPQYSQLICQYDVERSALWAYLNPQPRPCFTQTLLAEMRDLQQRVGEYVCRSNDVQPLQYYVYASAVKGVFNLGGDLERFITLIEANDRARLEAYARLCIEVVYANATGLGTSTLTTMSLIQGSALGGGFECALSCDTVVMEESARAGFPEILFNLFPGMGALSFLRRRIHIAEAARLMASGATHSGKHLHDIGAIEVLARDGEGVRGINDYIRHHRRAANGHAAIRAAVRLANPVSYRELSDVVEIWVDAALRLTKRDLRTMQRLVSAQERLLTAAQDREPYLDTSVSHLRVVNA